MDDRNQVFRRIATVETATMKAETLLFDPKKNRFCRLNATAAFIWGQLDRPATVAQVAGLVCARFAGVDQARAEEEVAAVLKDLCQLELVAQVAEIQ